MACGVKSGFSSIAIVVAIGCVAIADPLPPDLTYRPLPTLLFSAVKENDEAQKPVVMERQRALLEHRYDLANRRGLASLRQDD